MPALLTRARNLLAIFRPPLLEDLRRYDRSTALADVVAGIIVAVLLVPQGMAYALLAGLPAQYGLYAAIVPPVLYALFGTARTLAVGPVAVAALMVAEALHGYTEAGGAWADGTVILAVEVGVLLLAGGVLGLGRLVAFVGHPVLCGFTNAAALLILISQIGPLLDVELARGDALVMLADLWRQLSATTPLSILVATVTLAALLLGRSPLRRGLQALGSSERLALLATRVVPLAVVIGAALVVGLTGAPVTRVGSIPAGLPEPSLDFLHADGWRALLPSSALIALIAYVESVTVARVLAARHGQHIDPARELVALGLANMSAGVVGTMPVAGGFSRSVVNDDAGARTQVAALVTAALVAAVALWLTAWFATLPKAVLAAIIIVAVAQLIDLREALWIGRFDHGEGLTLAVTFLGVLALGIEPGLLAGIGISLALYLWRTSRPHMAIIGRIPGTETFRNVRRHAVECARGVVLVRVDENLYFANVDAVRRFVMDAVSTDTGIRHLVLCMTSVSYVDSAGVELLGQLDAELGHRGIALHLAETKGPVADQLTRVPTLQALLDSRAHTSLAELFRRFVEEQGTDAPGAQRCGREPDR